MYNLYGPSEDTTYSTFDLVLPSDMRPTIGRPLAGRHAYLLDEVGHPVADGDVGEIYLGGAGVARGYWRRSGLTQNAFLKDPWGRPGGSMYRTGDFARAYPDGRLEFLGRRDDQIKLRGYRIDLGEIDAVLRSRSDVEDVATVAVADARLGHFLRCALVLRAGSHVADVEGWVRARLPSYMVPVDWLALDAIPRLSNGKVDRTVLRTVRPPRDEATGSAPDEAVEARLAKLWSDLLGVARIGRNDDFFAMGGHSLLAARLSGRLRDVFGVDIPVSLLLRGPKLFEQADLVRSATPAREEVVPRLARPGEPAVCSYAQQRMWTLDNVLPGCARYNIPIAFRLRGPVDVAAMSKAIERVVEQYPVLRTVYTMIDGRLYQVVLPPAAAPLTRVDLSALPTDAAFAEAVRHATAFVRRCFDLERQPQFDALLLELGCDEWMVAFSTHHIAIDGSQDLIVESLSELYAQALQGAAPPPPIAVPSYVDYATWQRTVVEGSESDAALSYWLARLAGSSTLHLPTDRPMSIVQTGAGGRHECILPAGASERIAALGRAHGTTLFQTLLAATWAFLARLCDQDDVCVAAPLADRPHPDVERCVGNFVNTVILRGSIQGDPSFAAVLALARSSTIEAIENGAIPFDKVVETAPTERQPGSMPFANVMMSVLHASAALTLEGVVADPIELPLAATRFDLGFFFRHTADAIALAIEYNSALFDADTVRRYAQHWLTLMEAAVSDPTTRLSHLPLLTPSERTEILETWNATQVSYDSTVLIHGLFEDRVRSQPDLVAVVGADEALTYDTLDQRTNRLANALVTAGFVPGEKIALLCDRGPHLVVAMLGVLKAGCAYIPLDTDAPAARHAQMLRIADAAALITDNVMRGAAEALAVTIDRIPCLRVDAIGIDTTYPDTRPRVAISSESLAYVIFTSGTTGQPKAVAVRHRPVINLVQWVNRTYGVCACDRVLFVTSVAFDLSVYDVFGLLAAGGSIRVASRAEVKDPRSLARIVELEPVTFWNSAPAALEQCIPYFSGSADAALRLVFLSGDWIAVSLPDQLRAVFPRVEVVALGGATEAVVWSNHHRVETVLPGQTSIPYGRPIQNARYHILDRELEPVPIGVPGDLFIGGEVLADGYLGDPNLTAARFIPDPFSPVKDARLYRTGDRARYRADGSIEFLGRLDTQLKIRGFRVEAGEVEAVLAAHEGVRQAHMALRGDRSERWLCAYVVPNQSDPDLAARLRIHLRDRLPEYMVPAAIVILDAFPLTANGKLDRASLPAPPSAPVARDGNVAPTGEIETLVAEIWRSVLCIDQIGAEDNFFDVGGNSLRLIQVHRRIEASLGTQFPVVELFRHTTIRGLSQWLLEPASVPSDMAGVADARDAAGRQRLKERAEKLRNKPR